MDAGSTDTGIAQPTSIEPELVYYGDLPGTGATTIADLDRRAMELEAAARGKNSRLQIIRGLIRSARAVVEVQVVAATPLQNAEMGSIETHYAVNIVRVLRAITGYVPSVTTIACPGGTLGTKSSVYGDQPSLVVGRRYFVIKGVGDGPIWRGQSHLDVFEVTAENTLIMEGSEQIPMADFETLLAELNADAEGGQHE